MRMVAEIISTEATLDYSRARQESWSGEGALQPPVAPRPLSLLQSPELQVWEDDQVFEFTTRIRDREASCFWANGSVSGDEELIERIGRAFPTTQWTLDPIAVAHAISQVVIYPVHIAVSSDFTASGKGSNQADSTRSSPEQIACGQQQPAGSRPAETI
jgi:hypothetical protein